MNYWQISAGDGTTDMIEIFKKAKVALMGPGNEGNYFDNKDKYKNMKGDGPLVRQFAEQIEIGDVMVLKHIKNPHTKIWNILAVGEVVGPYRWESIFDKVDDHNWDVQHCRRVNWHVLDTPVEVTLGGAPVRIQKLDSQNPLKVQGEQLYNQAKTLGNL